MKKVRSKKRRLVKSPASLLNEILAPHHCTYILKVKEKDREIEEEAPQPCMDADKYGLNIGTTFRSDRRENSLVRKDFNLYLIKEIIQCQILFVSPVPVQLSVV